MSYEWERSKWDAEVDEIAARLIRNGTPPYQAIRDAVEILSRKRRFASPQAAQEPK